MSRIKLEMPGSYPFECSIPVRITDMNYGGHAGNDSILSLVHEARMRFLAQFGYTELKLGSVSLIMADAAIEYKAELFYGEPLFISICPANFSRMGFDLYYKLEKEGPSGRITVALVKTGMVCFDYTRKKPVQLPEEVKARLAGG